MSSEHQLQVDNRVDSVDIADDDDESIAPEHYVDVRMLITKFVHYLQEATTLIELAVWKGKYNELLLYNGNHDHDRIRADSYTQSGAVCAVVIPFVLSFL